MKNIQNTINYKMYGYNPEEFIPIYRDGKLDNRFEFGLYKTALAIEAVMHGIERSACFLRDVSLNIIETFKENRMPQ